MNENQMCFLSELRALFNKYNIQKVNGHKQIDDEMIDIRFWSNGDYFSFNQYEKGCFFGIEYTEYLHEFKGEE